MSTFTIKRLVPKPTKKGLPVSEKQAKQRIRACLKANTLNRERIARSKAISLLMEEFNGRRIF